jgi:hypothetical protein
MGRVRGGHAGVLPADGAARGLRSEPAGLFLRSARLPQLGGGAKLLAALPAHEEGAKAILIEAECPEKADDRAMAVRRLGFYARCGAVDTGWTEHLFDAWFRVLVLPAEGEALDAETANKELADCYSRVMGADKWRRYVQLYRPDGTEEKF